SSCALPISEFSTLTISDWLAHTPKDVLSANFGVPENAFNSLPSEQVYICQGNVPGSVASEDIQSPYGKVPMTFKHE
ncbi:oxalate decarboxylase, partial [Escherichia coli]|nr:oxalate decarboxylase [Escherichia coli]